MTDASSPAKLTMQRGTSLRVGQGCLFDGSKGAKMCSEALGENLRAVSTGRENINSLDPGSAILMGFSVALVLAARREPKVAPSVVQAVAVDMVNLHGFRGFNKKAMQKNDWAFHRLAEVGPTVCVNGVRPDKRRPAPRPNKRSIAGINDGIVPSRERNVSNFAFNADVSCSLHDRIVHGLGADFKEKVAR